MKTRKILVSMLAMLTIGVGMFVLTACQQEKKDEVERKCVHDYSVVYAEIAGDCSEQGSKIMGCSKCGESITIPTDYLHDYGEATCTEPASCLICGEPKDLKLAEHTWMEANCTEPQLCLACGMREGYALGHNIVEATCVEDAYCANCDYVYAGTAHGLTSAFGTLVEEGVWADVYNAVDENGYYYVAPADCFTEGYAPFDFCRICLNEVISPDNLEWATFNLQYRTNAEKMAYLFGSGLVYAEGYEVIAPSHTMVNYWGTQNEVKEGKACFVGMPNNETGEYIASTCVTNGLKNFKVCRVCDKYGLLDKPATYYNILAMVTAPEGSMAPAVYAEGFEEANVPELGHLWNQTTGKCERDFCEDVCEHTNYQNGVCTVCGKQE